MYILLERLYLVLVNEVMYCYNIDLYLYFNLELINVFKFLELLFVEPFFFLVLFLMLFDVCHPI